MTGVSPRRSARARSALGFTLAEVMIALAILGLALTMLVKSIYGNIASAHASMYMGVAGDLARGKMYDIEEYLSQEGFKDTEEHDKGNFADEGWEGIEWEYRVIPVELPSFEKLVGLTQGDGSGSGSGSGSEDVDGDGQPDPAQLARFQDSMMGQLMSMFGGMGGDPAGGAGGADLSMVQMAYPIIQETLKKSIRKIVLTVRWDTGFEADHADLVLYVTDTPSMCKAIPGGCR